MAELVAEAARRAWPELAFGAPTFENILKHSVIALRQNRQPLTKLADLLTDKLYREQLLRHVTDPQVVRFFHLRMDQWGRDEAHMKVSTLNRADLLTLSPFLRASLGAAENTLNFRHIIDAGRSVIIKLALPHCLAPSRRTATLRVPVDRWHGNRSIKPGRDNLRNQRFGHYQRGRFDDEWATVCAEMAARYGIAALTDEQLLVYPR